MPNSSDTWKTGEHAAASAAYLCLNCMQGGKSTEITVEKGAIFPHCETCGSKDATYQLKTAVAAR